jgi:Na+-transporting methylmalonyl-CoA/oxaloacetate decarboxylase gamma subunit
MRSRSRTGILCSVPSGLKKSYTTYSIGVGVVWAVLLLLAWLFDPAGRWHNIVLVFLGFALGWLSATIARLVYPPPKSRSRVNREH